MARSTEKPSNPAAGGKRRTTEYYEQVCAAHEVEPSAAELQQIELAVGSVASTNKVRGSFQYGLLYFLPKSKVVFEKDTLLVGWVNQEDGSEKEVWFKRHNNQGKVYRECGAPPGSRYSTSQNLRLCDKWHPSLEILCKPWAAAHEDCRRMLYAYFAAVIRYIQASPRPPSIESAIINRTHLSMPLNGAVASGTPSASRTLASDPRSTSAQDRDVHAQQQEQNTVMLHNQSIGGKENKTARRTRRKKSRVRPVIEHAESDQLNNESHEEDHAASTRFLPTGTAPIIDLTASDSEDSVKHGPVLIPELEHASRDDHQPISPAKQELLDKLQSKKVHEIEDMLAKGAGLLPDWIVKIMEEEKEKKMTRDLQMIENWF